MLRPPAGAGSGNRADLAGAAPTVVDSPASRSRRAVTQHRPGHVTLAASSFVVAGLAKLVALPLFIRALAGEAAFLSAEAHGPALSPAWLARAAVFVVGHLNVFIALWMLLGLFMIVGAAGLGRRSPWARVGLEAVCWFGCLEAPLVAAFIYSVRAMLRRAEVAGGAALASSLASRFWVSLAWLGVYVVLLILLKRTDQGERTDGQAEGQS